MMTYNNGFPMNYPYLQQQVPQMPQSQPSNNNNGLICAWIKGEMAANSFLVAPNTSVLLMDSEAPVFYIKTADASGIPHPLRIFDYSERTAQTTGQNDVTNESTLNAIQLQLNQFMERMDDFEKRISDSASTQNRKGGNAK